MNEDPLRLKMELAADRADASAKAFKEVLTFPDDQYVDVDGQLVPSMGMRINERLKDIDQNSQLARDLADPARGAKMVAAGSRTQDEKNKDLLSIKDIGAAGNGVSDDTRAWEALYSGKGVRVVPEGKYSVNGEVRDFTYGGLRLGEIRISDTGWDKDLEPVHARSTPQTALASIGGHYDMIGAAGRNYQWGAMIHLSNPNTAPITGLAAISQGYKARALEATSRQCGDDGDGHSFEIMSGQYSSKANVAIQQGNVTLSVNQVTFRGSKFCVGNEVKGVGIPEGAKIVSVSKGGKKITARTVEAINISSKGNGYKIGDIVTVVGGDYTFPATARVRTISGNGAIESVLVTVEGNYITPPASPASLSGGSGTGATASIETINGGLGYPDFIELDLPATRNSGAVSIAAYSADTQQIGMLITGSGDGGRDGTGNPNGRGIQFQSYGEAAFLYGINMGPSAIRPNGTAYRASSVVAQRGMSFEGCSFEQLFRTSSGRYTNLFQSNGDICAGSAFSFGNLQAQSGINFSSSCNFSSGAAILLNGQNIATDSAVGMKVGTSPNQRIAFWGATPVTRPTGVALPTGGEIVDDVARQALTNLITALRQVGIIGE